MGKIRNHFWKNSIFLVVYLLINSHLAFAQLSEPTDNLENVKRMDIYLYKAYDVETKKDAVTFYKKQQTLARTVIEYDRNGNEVLRSYYHPATNDVQESYVYEYDTNNQLIQEQYVLKGKMLGGKTVYSYDKQGRKDKIVVYSSKEEIKDRMQFEYDSNGNLIAEKKQNFVGAVFKEIQYKYDERNNQIEKRNVKAFLVKNNEPYHEIQTFDDSNRLISRTHYDDKDSVTWKYTARYDNKNRLVEEQTVNGYGKTTAYGIYAYNKKGLLESSYTFDMQEKSPPLRIEYKYDKNGLNIVRDIYVQETTYSPKQKTVPTITKRYYYDKNGNWYRWWEVNHTENTQGIAERKIVYF
ncbi:MAG: hypothetical protein FWH36_04130 [Lentimicrobiaceae bacterium]|nr:hypothetical protein [Lentimicrobiaceae bacterium]